MKETIKHNRKEITWTLTKMRDDLDFVDDIALLSHRHSDLQKKKNQPSCKRSSKDLPENQQRQNQSNDDQRKIKEPITLGGTIIEY